MNFHDSSAVNIECEGAIRDTRSVETHGLADKCPLAGFEVERTPTYASPRVSYYCSDA